MTETERAEFDFLTRPTIHALGLPLAVRMEIIAAVRTFKSANGETGPGPHDAVNLAVIGLDEPLLAQLIDAFKCGCWRGDWQPQGEPMQGGTDSERDRL